MKKLLLAALVSFTPVMAGAAFFDFTGFITRNVNSGPSVDVGSPFQGWAEFDLLAPVVDDPYALPGTYFQTIKGFSLTAADKTVIWNDSGSFMTCIDDGPTRDGITIINGVLFDNGAPGEFAMGFRGGDGSIVTDISLSNFRKAMQFDTNSISFDTYKSGWAFEGRFTSFDERQTPGAPGNQTENPVPEPSSIALCLAGLLLLKRKLYA